MGDVSNSNWQKNLSNEAIGPSVDIIYQYSQCQPFSYRDLDAEGSANDVWINDWRIGRCGLFKTSYVVAICTDGRH